MLTKWKIQRAEKKLDAINLHIATLIQRRSEIERDDDKWIINSAIRKAKEEKQHLIVRLSFLRSGYLATVGVDLYE